MADAFGKREIRIFVAGAADVICLALLSEVTGAGGLAADADEGGEIAERFAFMDDDGAEAGVEDVWRLAVAGLEFVLGAAVVAVGPGDGADQRGVVHLLGELRENFRDLHAID